MSQILTKSFPATEAVAGMRIAKFTGERNKVALATAATDRLAGVTEPMGAVAGGQLDLIQVGLADLQAGGAFEAGDKLTADAAGKAIKALPVAGQTIHYIATAQDEAVAGDIVPTLISPGVIVTPA